MYRPTVNIRNSGEMFALKLATDLPGWAKRTAKSHYKKAVTETGAYRAFDHRLLAHKQSTHLNVGKYFPP